MDSLADTFDAMAETYRSRVYRAACLLLDDPHEAEDMTQQVFVEAWRGWERFEGRSEVFTWLYTILRRGCARYRCHSWWRFFRPKITVDEDALSNVPASDPLPHEAASANENSRSVRRLLACLSPPLREVLVLRYIESYSVPQIARVLRLPEGTVKSRIHYALRVAERQWVQKEKKWTR